MIPAPVYPKVSYVQQEYTQSQFIDDVYGGKYTFNPNAEPPSAKMILDQERLGAAAYCAAGFEPINFNTGNFFLQAQDVSLESNTLAVTRMYNTLSNEEDGAFGSKWGSELNMHLTLYGNGSISLRDSEGAMNVFYIQDDGSYVSDNEDLRTLTINSEKTEYTVHETDGTSYIFATAGLMKEIRKSGVTTMKIERDELGFMTGIVSQSGLRTPVEMDQYGHITKLTLADGCERYPSTCRTAYWSRICYITEEKRIEDGKTTSSSYAYDVLGELTSFTQSTGYGESYSYDAVGNMLQKVITPQLGADEDSTAVTLSMKYNKGNQLTTMASGKDKISYSYDANGNMIDKSLTSKQYGKLTDTYAYNVLDQLTSYTGYDGYTQQLSYDANGMRTTKKEAGKGDRSTLEELLRGEIAGLPDIISPTTAEVDDDATALPAELDWATTEYLYDITQEYYQVIEETTSSKNSSTTTAYAYGLERIAAYTDSQTTNYVYDGRGSVAQAITAPVAGEAVSSALPNVAVSVQSFTYTAFGEQMGGVKVSGFAYNAEAFDAATGMINLRARQYEPVIGRFTQQDVVAGKVDSPISLNRYSYVLNNPYNCIDPSGMFWQAIKKVATDVVNYVVENIIKPAAVNHAATNKAKSAANASGRKANELASEWYDYCKSNEKYLRGDVKKEYDKAMEKLKSVKPNTKKYYEIIVTACTIIKKNAEVQEMPTSYFHTTKADGTMEYNWNSIKDFMKKNTNNISDKEEYVRELEEMMSIFRSMNDAASVERFLQLGMIEDPNRKPEAPRDKLETLGYFNKTNRYYGVSGPMTAIIGGIIKEANENKLDKASPSYEMDMQKAVLLEEYLKEYGGDGIMTDRINVKIESMDYSSDGLKFTINRSKYHVYPHGNADWLDYVGDQEVKNLANSLKSTGFEEVLASIRDEGADILVDKMLESVTGITGKAIGEVAGGSMFAFGIVVDCVENMENNKTLNSIEHAADFGNYAKAFGLNGRMLSTDGELSLTDISVDKEALAANLSAYNEVMGTTRSLTEIWSDPVLSADFVENCARYTNEINRAKESIASGELSVDDILSENDLKLIDSKVK